MEVFTWDFKASQINRAHLQFRERLLGLKILHKLIEITGSWVEQTTKQNDSLSLLNTGYKLSLPQRENERNIFTILCHLI